MCGICGMVGFDPVDRAVLSRMTDTLRHRGPDDEGLLCRGYENGLGVGLGFRRLSIIDLETGNQPLSNESGSIELIFNGEIYNFRELRRELESRGHSFATRTDSEVIVHLYEDLGSGCVERLNGMFAFALWDEDRRELLLARDRFGKKPLYYGAVGRSLVFGSELKSLLEHPNCPRALDHESLARYLAFEYVPTPSSIISGIKKLPAGHILRWRDGTITVDAYWKMEFGPYLELTDAEYAEGLRDHLRAAVRRRLVSDVPLGAFLSGGVDSSSVVACMAEALPAGAVKTFTVGFGERSFDESEHARRVAAHFGTEHHEERFTARVMLDLLPDVFETLDEPFADASILPTYLLSRFTREHVTVVLGGDGSDELLAGYPTFPAEQVARFYPVPRALQDRFVVPVADRMPVSTSNFSFDFKVKRFLRGSSMTPAARHATWLGALTRDELRAVLVREPIDVYHDFESTYTDAPTVNRIERLIHLYTSTYLQDDILVKVDRASMACSLEVRAPFLDVELVEFISRVPPRVKLRRFDTKHVLKRAMADVLPEGIAGRPKKGFGIPVAEWFKHELRDRLLDELSDARIREQGIFNPTEVKRLIAEHLDGRRDHRKALWALFVFQLWHARWLSPGARQSSALKEIPTPGDEPGRTR